MDILAIEKGFRAAALTDGSTAFRAFLSSIELTSAECPECAASLNKIAEREKTIVSLMGAGEFWRGYYECPDGHGHFIPCDDIVGVSGTSFTPGVRLAVSKLASSGSFEWTSEALAEVAEVYVSPKEAQRMSEDAGEAIEVKSKERTDSAMRPEPPRSAPGERAQPPARIDSTLYIEYDGTGIPMTKREVAGRSGKQADGGAKTREAKLGCIFTQSSLNKKGDPVRDAGSTSYVGAIENAESFGWRIYAEAVRRGIESYMRVVVLGDGAKWIWGIASQHFPGAIQIVDLYHAKEHLYELVRKLFPQQNKQNPVLDEWIKMLEGGKIEALVKEIREVAKVDGLEDEQRDKALGEANYFAENTERMRYEKFKNMKLFVGSGVIEAGCKTVIGKRLKQSGMFWSLRGANAIIALRCADLSCNEYLASYFETYSKYLYDHTA